MASFFYYLFSITLVLALTSLQPASATEVDLSPRTQEPDFSGLNIPVYTWCVQNKDPKLIVVAFHGGCLDGSSFKDIAKVLNERDISVVSFDMRGFGKWYHDKFGTKYDETFRYDETRADIKELLVRLRHQFPTTSIIGMGESLGANMVAVVAGEHPELLDGIVMVSPYAGPRFFLYPQMLHTLGHFLRHPLSELDMTPYLQRRLADRREYAIAHINNGRNRDQQSAIELIRSWRLNKLGVKMAQQLPEYMPVLFLVGEYDRLCDPYDSYELFRKVPSKKSRFVMLPWQGHLMVETSFLNENVVETLAEWLNEQQRDTSLAKRGLLSP